jgi:hypothetical protein
MIDGIIEFIYIKIVPYLAIIMFVLAGILLFASGQDPQMPGKVKKMILYAVLGLVLIYGVWILVGSLLNILGVTQWQDPAGTGWFKIDCPISFTFVGGANPFEGKGGEIIFPDNSEGGPSGPPPLPPGEENDNGSENGGGLGGECTKGGCKGINCIYCGLNYCKLPITDANIGRDNMDGESLSTFCNTNPVPGGETWWKKINGAIQNWDRTNFICGNKKLTIAFLTAIINKENNGNMGPVSSAGAAGPFQVLPETANNFEAQCIGKSGSTCTGCGWPFWNPTESCIKCWQKWLANPKNIPQQICIAMKFLKKISTQNDSDTKCTIDCNIYPPNLRHLAAGYNGGYGRDGACGKSNSCHSGWWPFETDCGICNYKGDVSMKMKTRRWECLWENEDHTDCNEGYNETRKYVAGVMYCFNKYLNEN